MQEIIVVGYILVEVTKRYYLFAITLLSVAPALPCPSFTMLLCFFSCTTKTDLNLLLLITLYYSAFVHSSICFILNDMMLFSREHGSWMHITRCHTDLGKLDMC